tara:strand:+ start:1175 stop:1363 length:189 start_codon:yes stop_codon:yes gene_type:complete
MDKDNFKARRLELGLTQTELGNRLGLTCRSVQFYEAGKVKVPNPVAILIDIMATRKIPKQLQ